MYAVIDDRCRISSAENDASGRPTSKIYPDDSRVDYTYDARGNLLSRDEAFLEPSVHGRRDDTEDLRGLNEPMEQLNHGTAADTEHQDTPVFRDGSKECWK